MVFGQTLTAPTVISNRNDTSFAVADTSKKVVKDTVKVQRKKDIQTTVNYSAKDSMIFDVEARTFYLYKDSKVDYGTMKMNAELIDVNWQTNLVNATHGKDSTGKPIGIPVLEQGGDKYEAKKIKYNFKSKKGLIGELVTQQGEGFIHAETVKKMPDDVMYNKQAIYTTCNLDHPHFYIASSKIKTIPKDKFITGPFNLWIEDVPTPLGFFFGLFPQPKTKSAGIIVPTYGESVDRGFFLRNGGYYFPVGDFAGVKILGEIFSKGSYGINILSNYKKRYAFDGNIELRYNRRKQGQEGFENIAEDYWVSWSHSPVALGRNSRFGASVNFGSSNYNARNSFVTENFLQSSFRSNITYSVSQIGKSPFNLSVNASQDQNTRTGQFNVQLPNATLGMNRQYPFRGKNGETNTWYQKINFAWTANLTNNITNAPTGPPQTGLSGRVKLEDPYNQRLDTLIPLRGNTLLPLWRRSRNGISHSIPISTTFQMFKYISVSPAINYSEFWYRNRLTYQFNEANNAVNVDTLNAFSRAYSFNGGISATTRIYGTFFINSGRLQAIRHTLIPTVSYSFSPDFRTGIFGQFASVNTDTAGRGRTGRIQSGLANPFAQGAFGGPNASRSGNIGFSLQNTLEMKVKAKEDTSGMKSENKKKARYEKKMLIDNLVVSGAYNTLADSMKLSTLQLGMNTRLLDKFIISSGATLDPYEYRRPGGQGDGIRVKDYAWNAGQGIGRITNANIALNTSFAPKKSKAKKEEIEEKLAKTADQELAFVAANPNLYVDFDIPWTLNLSYNLNWVRRGGFGPATVVQTLNFSGDVSLTPKWKIGATSGYDFVNKKLGFTNLNIYRDLHCWEMRINWIPFGIRQSYSIDINVKSSTLRDLKLSRRRSWYDR